MKAKPFNFFDNTYHPCEPKDATHVNIKTPGPFGNRFLPVVKGKRDGTGCWSWNRDCEKPTLHPSVLTKGGDGGNIVCHIWINDGMVQFLGDCTHEFRNKTVPLLDIES